MTPVKSSRILNDMLPKSNLEIIKEVGHFLPIENAKESKQNNSKKHTKL